MRRFARLYQELDRTTRTSEKQAALERYFRETPAEDACWALWVLSENRLRRALSGPALFEAARERTGLPMWLLQECRDAVGDSSETVSLLLPEPARARADVPLREVFARFLLPMQRGGAKEQAALLREAWDALPREQRLAFHKLISGTFRVGAQRRLLARALARVAGVHADVMAHRLTGTVKPTPEDYRRVMSAEHDDAEERAARPYPFCLAHQLDGDHGAAGAMLGEASCWIAEWKWDGIRAQLIRRGGRTFLASRGEAGIEGQFPQLLAIGAALPEGTVLDGEVLAWEVRGSAERPLPFAELQTRLGRKGVQAGLFERTDVVFMAFDVLEWEGADRRGRAWSERRTVLEALAKPVMEAGHPLRLSEVFAGATWEELGAIRARAEQTGHAEGLMLKHRDAWYHVGRTRGAARPRATTDDAHEDPDDDGTHDGGAADGGEPQDAGAGTPGACEGAHQPWWKWKLDPFTIDAVLVAAQPGSGRRAGLYTDYTFAVWDGPKLVTFAKAYSGLTDEELKEVDAFVRRSTVDRAGPVRFVSPTLVVELAFQDIQASTRHKSGVALRFPRIARLRRDKPAAEADTLETLRGLLAIKERQRGGEG